MTFFTLQSGIHGLAQAAEVMAFHNRSIREVSGPHYTPQQIEVWLEGRTPQGYLDAQTGGENYTVAVDKATNTLIGFCGWKVDEICGLYVHPDYAGRGVGNALILNAFRSAERQSVFLKHLKASLNAETFYHRHGFVTVGRSERIKNGVAIPQIVMERPS